MWQNIVFRRSLRAANARALAGSHAESSFIPLGGIEQWVSIRGEDPTNPALLLVHGGPGAPLSIFTPQLRAWERHFNVVQWDQRCAGKTYRRHGCGELSFDLLASDGLQLAARLRERFGRVVLVGSSAGSIIALRMALEQPELFMAYVGT